jgi:hypothetical protein
VNRCRLLSLAFLGLLCLGIAACGSSSSSTSTSRSQSTSTAAVEKGSTDQPENPRVESENKGNEAPNGPEVARGQDGKKGSNGPVFKPHSHQDSGGGSGQFKTKGGDNSIQEFGGESSGSEFDEAATALHNYLDARAQRAWSAACRYLAAGVTKELIAELSGGEGPTSCGELLASLSADLPQAVLQEAAVADVGSLRVEDEHGFLLFHVADQADYFIPMAREGGHWRVAAFAPSVVP